MELRDGEHILFRGRPSWRALFSFYLVGILVSLAAGVIIYFAVGLAAAIGAAVGLVVLVLAIGWVRRFTTKYVITNRRLRIERGFIARKIQETRLDRVQNVNYSQGISDRILRVGTVDFDTAGSDDSEFHFEWVNDPESVVQAVDRAQAELQQQRGQILAHGLADDIVHARQPPPAD